jgi:hypothetical protein
VSPPFSDAIPDCDDFSWNDDRSSEVDLPTVASFFIPEPRRALFALRWTREELPEVLVALPDAAVELLASSFQGEPNVFACSLEHE